MQKRGAELLIVLIVLVSFLFFSGGLTGRIFGLPSSPTAPRGPQPFFQQDTTNVQPSVPVPSPQVTGASTNVYYACRKGCSTNFNNAIAACNANYPSGTQSNNNCRNNVQDAWIKCVDYCFFDYINLISYVSSETPFERIR